MSGIKNEEGELVSVLIPAYNHENYVQDTIMSIINQTYPNIELLVIDDGSPDSTWQKVCEMKEECEKRFARVYFETKENEGTCKTFNKLLDLAKGEYVYIIASDDIAKPKAIETEIEFLSKHNEYALCVGDNEFIDSQSKVCYWDKDKNIVYSKKDSFCLTFGEYLQKKRKFNFSSSEFGSYRTLYIRNYVPNGYLIRKDIFNKTGYFTPEAPLEDYYLMLQISKYAKMKYIDEVLFSYRWHDSNTIKDDSKITLYTDKTREYEKQILDKIDENTVFEEVLDIKKNGMCYRKQGIPFLFQILSYKNNNVKTRIIRIFGIEVMKWKKHIQ